MSTPLLVSHVALWVLVIAEAIALLALYRHFGEMYLNSREGRSVQGPDVDSVPKHLMVTDVAGRTISLPAGERPRLLLFASTDCKLCDRIRDELPAVTEAVDGGEIVVVCAGHAASVRTWAAKIADDVAAVVPDPGYRVATAYGVGLTPFLVGVGPDGAVRTKGIANDRVALEAALAELFDADRSMLTPQATV